MSCSTSPGTTSDCSSIFCCSHDCGTYLGRNPAADEATKKRRDGRIGDAAKSGIFPISVGMSKIEQSRPTLLAPPLDPLSIQVVQPHCGGLVVTPSWAWSSRWRACATQADAPRGVVSWGLLHSANMRLRYWLSPKDFRHSPYIH